MTTKKSNGLLLRGSLRQSGLTFYERQGTTVVRAAHSYQPRRRTRAQFECRMKMRHGIALWQAVGADLPAPAGGGSFYGRFLSLCNRLPVVYVPRAGRGSGGRFLMPGIPASEGTLPPVEQWLGEVEGVPALLTALEAGSVPDEGSVQLYALQQRTTGNAPSLRLAIRTVAPDEWVATEGRLALADSLFGDPMRGWALVRVDGDRRSTQCFVTRCTLYRDYTTEEAFLAAVRTYGGLTS